MSKLSFKTVMTYFDKFDESKYRWLLVNRKPRYLDHEGWLDTRREWHPLEYFNTKAKALNYLENRVPTSEIKDWLLYESRPTKTIKEKE